MTTGFPLSVGIGWRQEIDLTVPRLAAATGPGVDFVEVVAENVPPEANCGTVLPVAAAQEIERPALPAAYRRPTVRQGTPEGRGALAQP